MNDENEYLERARRERAVQQQQDKWQIGNISQSVARQQGFHKSAEEICAWARGEQIQYRRAQNEMWTDFTWQDVPKFADPLMWQFRVKPPRDYPVTRMTDSELIVLGPFLQNNKDYLRALANDAIRRAIDDGDVVEVPLHERKPL